MARSRRSKLVTFERGTVLAKILGGAGLIVSIMTASPLPAILIGVALGVVHKIDKDLQHTQQQLGSMLTQKEADKFKKVIDATQKKLNGIMRRKDVAISDEAFQLCNELNALLHTLREQLRNPEDVARAAFTEQIGQLRVSLEKAKKIVKSK